MSNLSKSVNACLDKMTAVGGVAKGTYGEQAVLKVCESFYQTKGGILYHSYKYPVNNLCAGNIKRNETGKHYIENTGSDTEIDVLYVSEHFLYVIEVKAYKAKEITLDDAGIAGCFKTDKSPVHQNEMHCRHLYEWIYGGIPDGESDYIKPIVVFADKADIVDKRTNWQKKYIKVTTLSGLYEVIENFENNHLAYRLDLENVAYKLNELCISSEKKLPLRIVN